MGKTARLFNLTVALLLASCGYTLKHQRNALIEDEGIRKIYIKPVSNDTFKAGAENMVYNALVQQIVAERQLKLVFDRSKADAELETTITTADFTTFSKVGANRLNPEGTGPSNIQVANAYRANLRCYFALKRFSQKELGEKLWSSSFTRTKVFSANNQLGVLGTTSAIINESEFDRALQELSEAVAQEFYESMLELF